MWSLTREMEIQMFSRRFSYAIPSSSKRRKGSRDYFVSLAIIFSLLFSISQSPPSPLLIMHLFPSLSGLTFPFHPIPPLGAHPKLPSDLTKETLTFSPLPYVRYSHRKPSSPCLTLLPLITLVFWLPFGKQHSNPSPTPLIPLLSPLKLDLAA